MEKTKFFKNVWRFNGLIISVAGVLAIVVLFFAGYHVIKDIFRKRQVRNIVNIAENDNVKEEWTLGYMRQLDGTEYVMVPLQSDQSYAQSYYSKSSYSVRNFLFINVKTNGKEWLFPNNKWLIANNYTLSEKEHREKDRKIRAILYNIVKSDTNEDGRLTEKDKLTIALSSPSGKNYREILAAIDLFIGHSLMGSDTMLILYQKNNIGYSANVSLKDFTLSNQSELPKIKGDS